ncbi:MAG: metal-dependent hydrolase [Methanosarcinales archaeon]
MPYPPSHILFLRDFANNNANSDEVKNIFFIIFLMSFTSLFADIGAIIGVSRYKLHNIPFTIIVAIIGGFIGYVFYKNTRVLLPASILAAVGHLSHLILDELSHNNKQQYLYPFIQEDFGFETIRIRIIIDGISLFYHQSQFLFMVLYFAFLAIMAIFALEQLGYEIRYKKQG